MPYGFVNTWNTAEDACSPNSLHLNKEKCFRPDTYFHLVRTWYRIMFGWQRAVLVQVKYWVGQRLDCLSRPPWKCHTVEDLSCMYHFKIFWIIALRVHNKVLFWARIKARAGEYDSLHLHFAAISQVWKLRCENRQSSTYYAISFLLILHTTTSASVLNTKLLITNSFEVKLCF